MKASVVGQNAILGVQQRDDLRPQKGKVAFHHLLQNVRLHQIVGVNQNVPGANDAPPGNFGMRGAVRFPELVRCFPNDFEVAAHGVQNHLLFTPVPSQAMGVRQDSVDTLADMGEIEARIFHGQLQRQGFGQHTIPDQGMQAAGIDQIDRRLQKFAKVLEKGAEVEDILSRLEINEKVDIASGERFASRHRTENSYISRTVTRGQRENRGAFFDLEHFERHLLLLCINITDGGRNP